MRWSGEPDVAQSRERCFLGANCLGGVEVIMVKQHRHAVLNAVAGARLSLVALLAPGS